MKNNYIYRESKFELLRIVAMFIIVGSHYAVHGVLGWGTDNEMIFWNNGDLLHKIQSLFFEPGGTIGVAVFFMLAGYFGILSSRHSPLKVVTETIFYGFFSVVLYLILGLFYGFNYVGADTTIYNILKSLFSSVSSGAYWFVTVYVLIMILSPVINKFIVKYNCKGCIIFLVLLWIFEYSIPEFVQGDYYTIQRGLFFYCVGAVIRLYKIDNNSKLNKNVLILTFAINWVFYVLSSSFSNELHCNNDVSIGTKMLGRIFTAIGPDLFTPICAISLFLFFSNIDIGKRKQINTISKTTFGIYLMHDSALLRPIIWQYLLKVQDIQYNSNYFVFMMIGSIFLVFIVCMCIDLLRIKYLETRINGFIKKIIDNFDKKYHTVKNIV